MNSYSLLLSVFKNKFRKIENLTKKCVNLEGAIKFLYTKICLEIQNAILYCRMLNYTSSAFIQEIKKWM